MLSFFHAVIRIGSNKCAETEVLRSLAVHMGVSLQAI
jgi:hypothetical protein